MYGEAIMYKRQTTILNQHNILIAVSRIKG